MGQAAAVDLPDPLGPMTRTAPSMSADDLLAQLAGEEIDRLLAEADTRSGAGDEPLPSEVSDTSVIPQLQELLDIDTNAAEATAPATAEAINPLVGKLDETISQAAATATTQVLGPTIQESAVAAATVPAGDSTAPTPAPASSGGPAINFGIVPAAEQPTTAAERAQLAPADDELANRLSGQLDDRALEERPPLLVRLLELINLPFSACPQVLRDTLGKVAILTALNSIGVLAYVMLFRRH